MFTFSLEGSFEVELLHLKDKEIFNRIVRTLETERAKDIRHVGNSANFQGG